MEEHVERRSSVCPRTANMASRLSLSLGVSFQSSFLTILHVALAEHLDYLVLELLAGFVVPGRPVGRSRRTATASWRLERSQRSTCVSSFLPAAQA